LRSLGDCILMTPSIRLLKECWPHLSLSVLVERPFRDVFQGNPFLDEVFVMDREKGFSRDSRALIYPVRLWRSFHAKFSMARQLRQQRFDLILNYHGGSTSLLLMAVCAAPYRAGYSRFRSPKRYTHLLDDPNRYFNGRRLHTLENQAALLLHLGLPTPDSLPSPEIYIPAATVDRIEERLSRIGFTPGNYFHVHPTATLETKLWPPRQFARFIRMIQQHFETPILLTCGPKEEQITRQINADLNSAVPVFSDLTIRELAAVIQGSSAFVGCDSGPTHIASALKKKVCVVFGSSNAITWRPWDTEHSLVRLPFPCNPCPGYRCEAFGRPRCILEIEPEMVFNAFCDLVR